MKPEEPEIQQEAENRSVRLKGIGVSPGVAVGPAFVLAAETVRVPERRIEPAEIPTEIMRLEDALIATRRQLRGIQSDLVRRAGLEDAGIFDAHLMVLDDRAFIGEVITEVRERHRNVEWAVRLVAEKYADALAALQDGYLRERVADVQDVARRVIRNLMGGGSGPLRPPEGRPIVVAPDLAPSDTAVLRREVVLGFATDLGSPTSHTAVMARALEIPAVVALHDITARVTNGDPLLIDGTTGVLILRPTPQDLAEYDKVAEARSAIRRGLSRLAGKPAETTDGHRIVVSANIEGTEEIDAVAHYGAEGVGLFRSEYLFLRSGQAIGEEDQTRVYREVASRLAPAPVIIRTLDLGGDKFFGPGRVSGEANPFLGCRSIRLSLLYPETFLVQLRAILRANEAGNVKVMFPMISNLEELLRARELLEQAKQELARRGEPFDANLEVGIMVEVPSAALTADLLAEHADFFSLGTNDLVQYTLAVDRVNERVAYLYEPAHPAVLKLIRHTVLAGHRRKRWVGLCGEMAADPLYAPLLVGLGLDEVSMAPSAVPLFKDAVRSVSLEQATRLARTALRCRTASEVLGHCRRLIQETAPELLELI